MRARQIPNRLWLYRDLMGLKQKDVAKKLKLKCPTMVSRWEKGVSLPNAEQLLKLGLLYKVLPSDLYYEQVKEFEKELFDQQSTSAP